MNEAAENVVDIHQVTKLNLGSGDCPMEGYQNIDRKNGCEVYPLLVEPETLDEIRASHVLEHFSHTKVQKVLFDWVEKLKPGGVLKIAVPDFEKIARAYLAGQQIPVQGYVMGGHVDDDDKHGVVFDREALIDELSSVGLIGISDWVSEISDCAALPISLNLQGFKKPDSWPKVHAVMSTPRLGWNDFWGKALETLSIMKICLTKHTGAFWEQCLTRALDEALARNPEYILTLDYDTIFDINDVQALLSVAARNPEADAIAALQVHRQQSTPLMTVKGADGENVSEISYEVLSTELAPAATAHFGLTLIKAQKLRELSRPWFHGSPESSGEWGDNRIDPDISFWKSWERAGNSLYIANRIPVGHLEVMIRWPDRNLTATYQHPNDYHQDGKPEDSWR